MFGNNPSGPSILLRSLGIDPEELLKKGNELESLAKQALIDGRREIREIREQMNRIEFLLTVSVNQSAQLNGSVVPAGDSWQQVTT